MSLININETTILDNDFSQYIDYNLELKELAKDIIDTQEEEIALMKLLL